MFAARLIAVGAVTLVAVAGLVVSGAHAQSAGECGCFAASAGSAVGVATLSSTTGRVVVSGSAAPRIGAAGQRLSVGERVAVGANGVANVSLGSCSLAVQSGQELLLQRVDGGICASVPSAGAAVQSTVSPVPFVIGGTAALAVGVALAVSSGDDSPASP